MSQRVVKRRGRLPMTLDPWAADLEQVLPEFGKGYELAWGLVLGAVAGSWNEEASVRGLDWGVRFHPPRKLRIPVPREGKARARWKLVPGNCAFLTVRTGETDLNRARDVGRPAVRGLLGLLRREYPMITPSDVPWEGPVRWTAKRIRMGAADQPIYAAVSLGKSQLERAGLRLMKISISTMPPQIRQSLEWLALARSARVRPEKFIHLWLSVLTLASYGQNPRAADKTRIRSYTATMAVGIGGVRSLLSIADLNDRLWKAHKIRTDLLHRADHSSITDDLLESLEQDAFDLIDFELAKIGTPIPSK